MKEIVLNTETMTSLQIAEVTGKLHKDVLEAIRNMESAWVKVNGRKFPLVEYKDAKGEMRPMYQLNKTECLYVATKFKDEARARLVIRWEELERERMAGGFQIPQNFSEALRLAAEQAERVEVQQRQIEAMKPKALFADAVATSDRSCLVAELAKILQQNGVNIGQTDYLIGSVKTAIFVPKASITTSPPSGQWKWGCSRLRKRLSINLTGRCWSRAQQRLPAKDKYISLINF